MQPTKHMDPSENELIAHIKDTLMSHEESYVPGAWEKFKTQDEKKKPLIFWLAPLSGVAAILFIATGLYFFIIRKSDNPVTEIANTSPYKYNGPKPEKIITPAETPKEATPASSFSQAEAVVAPEAASVTKKST